MIGRRVSFRFHGELNDFLPPAKRNAEFEHLTGPTDTIKHVVESLGVPHTEFDRVTVNGELRASSKQLSEGDRIEVFPYSEPILLADPTICRRRPFRKAVGLPAHARIRHLV